jgi:hypothetical protein
MRNARQPCVAMNGIEIIFLIRQGFIEDGKHLRSHRPTEDEMREMNYNLLVMAIMPGTW